MADSRGNLWIATNDGISLRNANTLQWHQLYSGRQRAFLSLAADKKGHIYAGTYGEGVYVLDEVTGRELRHYTSDDGNIFGAGGFVFAAYTDSQGDVWLGGVRGSVYCCNSASGKLRAYDTQPVYCFAELSPGQILLGCAYVTVKPSTDETHFGSASSSASVSGFLRLASRLSTGLMT